jgi:hypothetical protein
LHGTHILVPVHEFDEEAEYSFERTLAEIKVRPCDAV